MHIVFKFAPEVDLETTLKLKVEINTREHENLFGLKRYPFEIDSSWYQAKTDILSFEPEELFATKLRALLQRRKNRDLFDLCEGLKQLSMDPDKLIACFEHYLALEGSQISRAIAEQRINKPCEPFANRPDAKMRHRERSGFHTRVNHAFLFVPIRQRGYPTGRIVSGCSSVARPSSRCTV